MNNRLFAVAVMLLLIFLIACESKTVGKRVAIPETSSKGPTGSVATGPTGAVTAEEPSTETGKTAAEMLKELQSNPTLTETGEKSGTFYPPITTDATGEEALKQKTRALFSQQTYDPNVEADTKTGARYHDSSGEPDNLPGDYSDNEGD
jgi:hypothetical protein